MSLKNFLLFSGICLIKSLPEKIFFLYIRFCDIPLHIASIPSPTIILVELSFLGVVMVVVVTSGKNGEYTIT